MIGFYSMYSLVLSLNINLARLSKKIKTPFERIRRNCSQIQLFWPKNLMNKNPVQKFIFYNHIFLIKIDASNKKNKNKGCKNGVFYGHLKFASSIYILDNIYCLF